LQQNCEIVGTYFIQELMKLKDTFEVIGDVRGKGLMIGVELVEDRVSGLMITPCIINALDFLKYQRKREKQLLRKK
jgi:4-aminobutyrate aminotransferase-like enzyme